MDETRSESAYDVLSNDASSDHADDAADHRVGHVMNKTRDGAGEHYRMAHLVV